MLKDTCSVRPGGLGCNPDFSVNGPLTCRTCSSTSSLQGCRAVWLVASQQAFDLSVALGRLRWTIAALQIEIAGFGIEDPGRPIIHGIAPMSATVAG